jgi:hypothetical protein
MFRIRESFPDKETVYLWFDGRLSEEDLNTSRKVIDRYLKEEKKIFVNLSNLVHVGWSGKRFLREIKDKVTLEEKPEHLKTEI